MAQRLSDLPRDLAEDLRNALVDEPPLLARDGGFVRKGYDEALDKERALASESRAVIAATAGAAVHRDRHQGA